MQTITIKVNDNYASKLFSFLELFPKSALKIETHNDKRIKELEKHRKAIQTSLDDIKSGKVHDTGIVVEMKI